MILGGVTVTFLVTHETSSTMRRRCSIDLFDDIDKTEENFILVPPRIQGQVS